MNRNFDKSFINSAINASGGKLDAETIKQATESGDSSAILNNLSQSDRDKINRVLKDKTALSALLKNPQVAEIMKKLSGGGKNG